MTFCISCTKSKPNIKAIDILYYNYIFETDVSIDCGKIEKTNIPSFEYIDVFDSQNDSIIDSYIDYQGVLDTIIIDKKLLEEIEVELLKLKPNDSIESVDSRISVRIIYEDGKEEILCIGGVFTNIIWYNNRAQQENNRLLFLIKNSIGYYKWLSNEDLKYMRELNDKSFKKRIFC